MMSINLRVIDPPIYPGKPEPSKRMTLIVLPFLGILSFSAPIALAIVGGILLIVKAFKDGEVLETEKFFLLISISNDKKQKEDGK